MPAQTPPEAREAKVEATSLFSVVEDGSTPPEAAAIAQPLAADAPRTEARTTEDSAADFLLRKDLTNVDLGQTQDFVPTPPPAASPSRPPVRKVTQLGDFRLLKELGKGGMGTVYKARQVSRPRLVALKVLFGHLAARPAFVQRFQREARLLARLDHPHIMRCYEVGEDKSWHYLAVELLEGGSLGSWLKRQGRFSVGDAFHVVLACARGLQYAHGQSLVHRDIKPDNILLTPRGVVKVADLGLAKATDDDLSLTQTGTAAGTPLYMAPEQARNAKYVDGRCDIYALGCMLYALLTGQPPFQGKGVVALLQAKEKGLFPPARQLNPEVPERVDVILVKMLARNPEQRYQSCVELIEDLELQGLAHPRLSFLPTE
jgi:serine/threonine-protein kinase